MTGFAVSEEKNRKLAESMEALGIREGTLRRSLSGLQEEAASMSTRSPPAST